VNRRVKVRQLPSGSANTHSFVEKWEFLTYRIHKLTFSFNKEFKDMEKRELDVRIQ